MASYSDAGEFRTVLVLSLGFGLVGLDRFIVNPLFPVIARDLGLTYRDIGLVSAALAMTWGIAAFSMGRLADTVGLKTVLGPSILVFSTLAGITGLASGLTSLLVVRALMGLAEGTFVPACIVAASRVSKPVRVGLNVGLLHMAAALFGTVLAPVAATQLLKLVPSWHWIFVLAAIPGFAVAYGIRRVLPTNPTPARRIDRQHPSWRDVLRHTRVVENAAIMCCSLANTTTMGALLPSYLTDHLHLGLEQMGVVLSLQGLGGLVGLVLVPGLADRMGYRRVAVLAAAMQVIALFGFRLAPDDMRVLIGLLFGSGLASAGIMAITVGPLTGHAVPKALAATATGVVVGAGEIAGGAFAPALAGSLATRFGIAIVPTLVLAIAAFKLVLLALGSRSPRTAQVPQATG